jgi:Tfp pilus assembly protein PilX
MQALIAICLALLGFAGLQTFRIGALKEEAAAKDAALAVATATAERQARDRESQMADAARKASDAYQANVSRVRASADSARTELDSLRNTLAAGPAAPASAASSGAYAAGGPERELLGACAATLQAMAAQADRLESKVIGLQDYIKGLTK